MSAGMTAPTTMAWPRQWTARQRGTAAIVVPVWLILRLMRRD